MYMCVFSLLPLPHHIHIQPPTEDFFLSLSSFHLIAYEHVYPINKNSAIFTQNYLFFTSELIFFSY